MQAVDQAVEHMGEVQLAVDQLVAHAGPARFLAENDLHAVFLVQAQHRGHDHAGAIGQRDEADLDLFLLRRVGACGPGAMVAQRAIEGGGAGHAQKLTPATGRYGLRHGSSSQRKALAHEKTPSRIVVKAIRKTKRRPSLPGCEEKRTPLSQVTRNNALSATAFGLLDINSHAQTMPDLDQRRSRLCDPVSGPYLVQRNKHGTVKAMNWCCPAAGPPWTESPRPHPACAGSGSWPSGGSACRPRPR